MPSKKISKKKDGAMVYGVINAIGFYSGINVSILRFIYILSLTFFGVYAFCLYILLALILPSEESVRYSNYNIK